MSIDEKWINFVVDEILVDLQYPLMKLGAKNSVASVHTAYITALIDNVYAKIEFKLGPLTILKLESLIADK